jgi:hypothetical protein
MSRARTARVRKLSAALPPRAPSAAASGELIAGITITIKGRELAVRIADRIRWHRERGDMLIQQMRKLTELERTAAEDLAYMLGRYESPRALLEKRLRDHEQRASFLAFVRDHIVVDATYRLDPSDLKMIDVLPPERM